MQSCNLEATRWTHSHERSSVCYRVACADWLVKHSFCRVAVPDVLLVNSCNRASLSLEQRHLFMNMPSSRHYFTLIGPFQSHDHMTSYQALHQFETHINRFLEPESSDFDPNHAFLSRIEAEINTFLPKKAVILLFLLLWPSYNYFNVALLPELIVRPQRPLIPKMVLLSAL